MVIIILVDSTNPFRCTPFTSTVVSLMSIQTTNVLTAYPEYYPKSLETTTPTNEHFI